MQKNIMHDEYLVYLVSHDKAFCTANATSLAGEIAFLQINRVSICEDGAREPSSRPAPVSLDTQWRGG